MTSGQKIAFSLLIAMGLFSVFVLGIKSTLFKELETHYYTQTKIEENVKQLNDISESCSLYITDILKNLDESWLKQPCIRSYYLQNPSESEVSKRRLVTEQLFRNVSVLNGIRIIDKNGKNLHFSTYDDTDVLKQNGITKIYKNYPDVQKDTDELSFETLNTHTDKSQTQVLLDENKNRLIVTMPYYWMDDIYCGLCVFYFNWSDIENTLTVQDVLSVGQKLTMVADGNFKGGFIFNLPYGNKEQFKKAVKKYLGTLTPQSIKNQAPEKLLEIENGNYWVGLSSTNSSEFRICGIYNSCVFQLSDEVILVIYICVFISILLIVYLIFSFTRNPEIVLKQRLKKLQYGIIKDCIEKDEKVNWASISRHLKAQKENLSEEILRSVKIHSRKKRENLNNFLESNWTEIFSIFDTKLEEHTAGAANQVPAGELTNASLIEIRKIIEDVLKNTKLNLETVETVKTTPVELDDAEELVDEVEELDDAEEPVDDVEELVDAEEPADDVEELDDAEEPADEVEELDDAEELVDEVEELGDAEETVDEVEELDDAEEPVDDVEELVDAEEPLPIEKSPAFNPMALLMKVPGVDYKVSNDSYFMSDDFATVENYNAEELTIGSHIELVKSVGKNIASDFKLFPLYTYPQEQKNDSDEMEELSEEVPAVVSYYSMTSFAENLDLDTPILEAANIPEDAIIEVNGVYSISKDLDLNKVSQDHDFKALVDSIL